MKTRCLPLLALLTACESSPSVPETFSDAAAFGVTDRAVYEVSSTPSQESTIRFTYSNRTTDTVWSVRCAGPSPDLEKLVDGEWVLLPGGIRTLCLNAIPIASGEQVRGEIRLSRNTVRTDVLAGTYRLVWELVWNFETPTETSPFGDLLPHEFRVSNRFELF